MPRFCNKWLTDRVLFDYSMGGQCACCGFSHFLPNGTADLINAVSDLETDDAAQEINALSATEDKSPWPEPLRNQVWSDRVRLRQKLKPDMAKQYAAFWNQHETAFVEWCHHQPIFFWKRFFQLPRSEIVQQVIRDRYNIHSAYGVVMCACLEQVAHFELTQYPPDARGAPEEDFEEALVFSRMGGFTLKGLNDRTASSGSDENDGLPSHLMEMWLTRMRTLCGPKLLEKRRKNKRSSPPASGGGGNSSSDDEQDEEETDAARSRSNQVGGGAGFASDRRILRLLIARYWADLLQNRFLEEQNKEKVQEESIASVM